MATLHIVTPEYPPARGGVADYTHLIARELAQTGEDVHVWCPPSGRRERADGFEVHAECGQFRAADLMHVNGLLDRFESPRRLLVQWVPHGYGFRTMNLPFCCWLWNRARRGDQVELMVHEPYLAFGEGTRQNAAAVVHRVMTIVLLQAARKVWVAIPAWELKWRPYTLGRAIPFAWLPVPSSLRPTIPHETEAVKRKLRADSRPLVGHLGTYGPPIAPLLDEVLTELLRRTKRPNVILIGAGSEQFLSSFVARHPGWAPRVSATGFLTNTDLAAHIAACDVLVQPYPDGISSRRTTAMAALHLGVPVVTTAGKLTEPLWQSSQAVRLSEVGDWPSLVSHIEDLLSDPESRRHLAAVARAFYDDTFDVRRTIAALRSAA
jgi:glycosyltransferase involved in cell wall biosynthesis